MFRFSLEIPGISIRTEMMCQSYERLVYTYIRWFIRIFKWHWELDWGRTRVEESYKRNN